MAVRYTEEQLNTVDKSLLIQMFLNQQEQLEALTTEVRSLNEKMQLMMEQLVLANRNRFGRSSEKMEDASQISFMEVDGTIIFFNEAEAVYDPAVPEPELLEKPVPHSAKKKGKKDQDLSGLPTERIDHYMTEEELIAEFGRNGWKQLPDAISRRYRFVPAKVEVEEHHIGVYSDKKDGHMVKAKHPRGLLHGIPVSPTLAAAIMNGKYVNAVPLYRLEQEFKRYGLAITRQNMANWMIRLGEEYLFVLYDYLHRKLYDYHVIQADETPVLVNHDGRPAGSKSYMWVYRSGYMYPEKQIVLYEYQPTRNASHPRVFLQDGDVPMDNNASERAIRGFCIGKKNWEVIDTINGAKTSAVIYSIAETAKANNLKPYEYFEHLLTVIPEHMEDTDRSFLEDLLPWSPKLPENIRK